MITAPKIHTDLLWDLSFLFIGLSVVYFLLVFIHKKRLKTRLIKVKQRKNELAPMISEFLFYEEDASKEDKTLYVNLKVEIRDLIKDPFNRKVLSDILLDLRKDLSGETQKRLFELYQDLDLHKDAFKNLKSWRWEVVSKAIQDLTKMQVSEAYNFITKFINDKRSTIRKQAEIATVTLKYEGINYFLDSTKYKISEWQQLKLLDVIRNQEDYNPPSFNAWLTSTNNHVVLFALRLIKFYNQNNANTSLIELLKHKNANIKLEAIACIKEFYVLEAKTTLKLTFWKSSTDIQIAILDAIGELGTEEDISFLELIDKKVSNFSVKSKAFSSINAISPERILPTKDIVDASQNTIPEDLPADTEDVQKDINEIHIEEVTEIDLSNSDTLGAREKLEALSEVVPEVELIHTPKASIESHESLGAHTEEKEELPEQTPVMNENIAVENEELVPETNFEKTEELEIKTVSTVNLDFLPVVIQKPLEEEKEVDHPDTKSNFTEACELLVSFDVVSSHQENISITNNGIKHDKKTYSYQQINMKDISFLPIVVDNNSAEKESIHHNSEENTSDPLAIMVQFEEVSASIKKDQCTDSRMNTYSRYNTSEILNLKIIYEDVHPPSSEQIDVLSFDVIDPVFLSFPTDETKEEPMNLKFNANTTKLHTSEEMNPQDEAKFKQIINSIINLENNDAEKDDEAVSKESSSLELENEAIDINFIPLVSEVHTASKDDLKEENEEEKPKVAPDSKLKIPNAIISDKIVDTPDLIDDDSEESTMQLLDDLDEMGDQREIPLLNEMLVNVKYKTVSSRVEKLIERFSEGEEKVSLIVQSTEDVALKPFNVFEDLFRVCDAEAKLILLDEVAIIGDSGDVLFLEGLLNDEQKCIREKVERVLIELKAKLDISSEQKLESLTEDKKGKSIRNYDQKAEVEVYNSLIQEFELDSPKEPSGLFDIAFELEFANDSQENSKDQPKKSSQDSIMNQICTFSSKIINRFNG